ncbi:hypothetical protein HaLaN_13760, partial [Haematococcus lacustris]
MHAHTFVHLAAAGAGQRAAARQCCCGAWSVRSCSARTVMVREGRQARGAGHQGWAPAPAGLHSGVKHEVHAIPRNERNDMSLTC